MPSKRRCYTGELAKPIVWPASPTFWGAVTEERVHKFWRDYEKHRRNAERRVNQKLLQKMSLLKKHFKIAEKGDAAALAWALAFQHVPGFRIVEEEKTKAGRKKEWHGTKLQALYDAVQSVKSKHGVQRPASTEFHIHQLGISEHLGTTHHLQGF
jgi:histidinol dehydrogenase